MSLKITTDKETEYKDLKISEYDNLIFLIYRSNYKSYFHFSYNDKTDKSTFHGYGGTTCSNETDDTFDDGLPFNVDLYITPNGMKSAFCRKSENLINLQNIVIDIDSHKNSLSDNEFNKHINDFIDVILDNVIIKPNFINKTGRGIHLWYCFQPCHVSLDKIVLSVIDMLCNNISDIMKNRNESILEIDRSSSLKLNGLFRVPYSYNTKSKSWSEGILIHNDEKNINEIRSKLIESGYKSKYFNKELKKKKKKKIPYINSKVINVNKYTPCIIHRKNFMDYLFRKRNISEGQRDIMLFAMYSTLINLYTQEESQRYCLDLNDSLNDPLTYAEMISIFKEVDKKRHKFKVQKFFDFINATDDEIAWFNKMTKKELEAQKKRDAKQMKYNKVLELYNNGESIVSISKSMHISRPTIYKIIGGV